MSQNPLLGLYGDYVLADHDGSLGRLATTLTSRVFDEIRYRSKFTFLKSSRRELRQALIDGRGVIIIDLGQAAALATGLGLIRLPSASREHGISFGNMLIANAFACYGRFERAVTCAASASHTGGLVEALHQRAIFNGDLDAVAAFLSCHELSHFAIDAAHPLSLPYLEAASETLEKHCAANLALAANLSDGVDLPPDVESSVTRSPAEARGLMATQSPSMSPRYATIARSSERRHAISCRSSHSFPGVPGYRWRKSASVP